MVSVPSDTMSPEQRREPQSFWNVLLSDDIVRTFWLSNNEFANLHPC